MNVDDVRMYNQTVFGSIGYATAAALGTYITGREDGPIKRNILVTGEGSLQIDRADILRSSSQSSAQCDSVSNPSPGPSST